jgi:hypothetical protein
MKIFAKHPIAAGFTACRWTFVRFFIIAVLLTAATLKAWQLATEPVLGEVLLHSRLLNVLIVEFEIFFSFWLIAGLLPKLTWLASIVLFSVFTIVSLFKAVTGETSCGCFGNVTVNPWITTVFDITVVGLLLFVKPVGVIFNIKDFCYELVGLRKRGRIVVVTMIWLIVAIPITYTMIAVEKNDIDGLGYEFVGADSKKMVVLKPENWVGNKFPLLPYIESIDIREVLKSGEHTVVLFHNDCPNCVNLINRLNSEQSRRIVCIEIPSLENESSSASRVYVFTKLTTNRIWIVETPLCISLFDGIVTAISGDCK